MRRQDVAWESTRNEAEVQNSLLGTQEEPLYDLSFGVSRDSDVFVSVGGDNVLFVRGEEEGGDGRGVACKDSRRTKSIRRSVQRLARAEELRGRRRQEAGRGRRSSGLTENELPVWVESRIRVQVYLPLGVGYVC